MSLGMAGIASAHNPESITCSNCKAWNEPQAPFQVYGNTYYVGTRELSAILVTGPKGHVLLDAALPQSAPLIEQNIKTLGFKLEDVKLILNSHAHFDHAGGIAALQRKSGALVATSAHGAQVLKDGAIGKDDPQYEEPAFSFPRVAAVESVRDGETLKAGGIELTAHLTPGHTPGSTTWTWKSCEAGRCLDVVYADSLTAVSQDGYRYTGGNGAPDVAGLFGQSIDKVGALKCGVLLTTHPGASGILERQAARTAANNPFIDAAACRALATKARANLAKRVATERSEQAAASPK
ncbi:MAG: subclass B3 metallo-beta-lactamase [Telluria sp.]